MRQRIYNKNLENRVPDKHKAGQWVEELFQWLFLNNDYCSYQDFVLKENELSGRLEELLCSVIPEDRAAEMTRELFSSLEDLYDQSVREAESILDFDPAAQSTAEIIAAYPGFFAVFIYRISHQIWKKNIPVIPRLMSEYVHGRTGIDIHPGAQIGAQFFIDHGTGVVIGETTVIGHNVKIYQGVTLGALSVSREKARQKRHPTIGDNVIIYSHATILGGDTVVGDHTVVGGNVWITSSIPPHSLVYHKSEVIVKNNAVFPEPINFVI